MPNPTDTAIAAALAQYLSAQIGAGPTARAFFRLEGFHEETYRSLLAGFAAQNWKLDGRTLVVRSIERIAGHAEVAMEPDRSATWHRNHLPAEHTLLLILNRRTSDAQSLKDLYAVSEQTLTRDGISALIEAAFKDGYQLDKLQRGALREFVRRLRRLRLEPQLRDLAEFLRAVNLMMCEQPGTPLVAAIADSLPELNLFRCRELAEHLNTPRGDKLLRALKDAAQIGVEVLDERAHAEYISRLEKADLADDSTFAGLSAVDKRALLRRFVDGGLGDSRDELLQVLRIDWHEVRQIVSSRGRTSKNERYASLAQRLQATATHPDMAGGDELAEVVESLNEGREPDGEAVERLLGTGGELLGKALRNDLRRLVRPRTRRSADFLVGLASVAVDLLHPRQDALAPGVRLRVELAPATLERVDELHEATAIFRAVYGGLEHAIPAIEWQLASLWQSAESAESNEPATGEERERVAHDEIAFRVAIVGADVGAGGAADLIWQYRSDSPAASTAQALVAEAARLPSPDGRPARLRVPIYNSAQPLDEIGDLDLRHPLGSLGAWYERPGDLRALLETQLRPAARPASWTPVEATLASLEHAWAAFVAAARDGLLRADPGPLLQAYENLLATALHSLSTGNEVGVAYRLLSQAWVIGPANFTTWAIVPLLHPLKLLWWRERARAFNNLIAQLLGPAKPALIVDAKRFQQELATTYGSSGFPPVLALPPSANRPAARFMPVEEAEGYELYFHEEASAEAFGLDTDLLAEDENELAALRAVEGIVAVVQDYIETYPFVRDGIEIVLFECRNGALPGLLVEQLTKASARRSWTVRLNIVVHTSERGAPLFRRVSKWVGSGHAGTERPHGAYFPPITVKVLQCLPEELFGQQEDTDIVVLADVLAERGQHVHSETEPLDEEDPAAAGYLPTYRARQEPFRQGEPYRRILLSPPQQPTVSRLFMLAQHAALDKRKQPPKAGHEARFYRDLTLDEWQPEIERLHDRFNWVICYDPTIDRFLLEAAFPDKVQVIRYSLGLGAKRQHNLTVSSSGRAHTIVTRRLATRLGQMFPQMPAATRNDVAERLVAEAKQVSGDIVLRAAGPGAFLNELIGLVVAKFETERRYRTQHPDALATWVLLDDFEHWFGRGKFPDLLFVAIGSGPSGELSLHTEVLEAKCVGELSFDGEACDAEEQVRRGVGRLAPAFAPGGAHLDALFWYDQLYRAIAGNLSVAPEQQELWELFRDQLHAGAFARDMSGHSWIFCYDGQAGVAAGPAEQPFAVLAPDAPEIPLRAHLYGRNELAALLAALIQARGGPAMPPEALAQPPMSAAPTQPPNARAALAPPSVEAAAEATPNLTAHPPVPAAAIAPAADQTIPPQPPSAEEEERRWLSETARELERSLRRRGVQLLPIDPAQADVGPSIVRFKLQLRPEESLRKVQGVAEDLARDLALAGTPLIANVLRTTFVGVDIPRAQARSVALAPLLQGLAPPGPAGLPVVVGVSPDGALVTEDLSGFPHLLVAGATNSGKSVFLRSLLLSLMTVYPAGKLELLVVDPKQTDFSFFDGLPHLRGGAVFTQAEVARDALLELVRVEMPRRQQLMRGRSLRIKEFNARFPDEALPPIVALIDEYAQLLSVMTKKDGESFERDLMSLAAVARSVGIHLVLATQRPSADIVTSTLKANLDARIAFRVASNTNSRVVLDTGGAENLLGRGDMLFRRPSGEIVRLQAPYMGEEEMQQYLASLAR